MFTTNNLPEGRQFQEGGQPADSAEAVAGRKCHLVTGKYREAFTEYIRSPELYPLLVLGDSRKVLKAIPDASVDCVMTSPPYWGKREYENGGIGQEDTIPVYVRNLVTVFRQIRRVLKPTGSFWLNMGDTYRDKGLAGIPWRVALRLTDREGWVMRNSVIWNKTKGGMDNTRDRLGNIHENVFHFVKEPKGYYFDADAIRTEPRPTQQKNGTVISSTGVSGVRYRAQIEGSADLSEVEKDAALSALNHTIAEMAEGQLSDFRMIIRGNQRTTHSDSDKVSGRAKELHDKGYYIIRCHPRGSKPADVWDIVPEDTQKRKHHFAPYPPELCRIPIMATCPQGGIVLDPFCGTGTTLQTALSFGRKSMGVDCSEQYLELSGSRFEVNHEFGGGDFRQSGRADQRKLG